MAADAHEHGGHEHDEACALAHGADVPRERLPGTLAVVYASPVARYLLHWGKDLGYATVLIEPHRERVEPIHAAHADHVAASVAGAPLDADADLVVTDHDRDDVADHLAAALATPARWIGLMGSRRHTPPHIEPLRGRGFTDDDIARIQRPIGLDIGSKTPPEIAVATLAGLVADRQGRPGGFYVAG